MLVNEQEFSLRSPLKDNASVLLTHRPQIHGKFFYRGEQKLWIRGVTYGTFRPNDSGDQFPSPRIVVQDFSQMAHHGFNSIRTYTVPPVWLLDLAQKHGLSVFVGLPWEQHITFLDDRARIQSIKERVRQGVKDCIGHSAILGYAVGNEIPASIVRWYGRAKIERFLKCLYQIVKSEDPDALVTYVNYPTTEYLQLSFLDFVCFNVYLENEDDLRAYLARVQNLAGERPLVLAEIGLDSLRMGKDKQAEVLDWQLRTVGSVGGAGAFVFSWTDEWYRGGFDIEDWDFGLTDRTRQPKPALDAVGQAFQDFPLPKTRSWPRISVVVCSYNGAKTIRETLEALQKLDYPKYEVIIVNDGSTDNTEKICKEYPFRIVTTPNQGLSQARNTGLELATGDIVAYTDDDAYPDPHWLRYLADMFLRTSHGGIGGPNLAPTKDSWMSECIANSPGGPIHVLIDDQTAEHIPGCNMAFKKECLEAVGGFDPQFRAAGDDVDVCWRLEQQGWTLGFHHSAMVWHHRRNSIRAYWKQQRGYGKAEALLERKWPDKYNSAGHLSWQGRLYGRGVSAPISFTPSRVYQGVWGSAPFQRLYESQPATALCLLAMPEWNLILAILAICSALGIFWAPLFWAFPFLVIGFGGMLFSGCRGAANGIFSKSQTWVTRSRSYLITSLLHLLQPLARLSGRMSGGLTIWRKPVINTLALPWPQSIHLWSEHWRDGTQRLRELDDWLRSKGAIVHHGGDFDRWDLEIRGGILGATRTRMTIEEHGGGKQLIRFRLWPKFSIIGQILIGMLFSLGIAGGIDGAWIVTPFLFGSALFLGIRMYQEHAASTYAVESFLEEQLLPQTVESDVVAQEEQPDSDPVPING